MLHKRYFFSIDKKYWSFADVETAKTYTSHHIFQFGVV